MTRRSTPVPELMSLRAAARLIGEPKEYLHELANAGRLAVYLTGDPSAPRWRVSRSSLVDAGLLTPAQSSNRIDASLSELIDLVKSQSARIATLEDQRFQLGAQLGAALERINALDDAPESIGPPAMRGIEPPSRKRERGSSVRETVGQLGESSLRRSADLAARLRASRLRLPFRFQDDSI